MTGQLARLEVPRAGVDFLADDLSGRQKLTVLKAMVLEDAISGLGRQWFTRQTRDYIYLEPVRTWAKEKWGDDFVYDFSSRNLPITFRTSLALGVLSARIGEHLEGMDGVEVYGSRNVQQLFRKHQQPELTGLDKIDFSKFPPAGKAELIGILINQLHQAEIVARARLLFPAGIDYLNLALSEPGFIMSKLLSSGEGDTVGFSSIKSLDYQATAANLALEHYIDIKAREGNIQQIRANETKIDLTGEANSGVSPHEYQEPEDQDIHYGAGTTFLQVFPYKSGETDKDLVNAFKRITSERYYYGDVDRISTEYFRVFLTNEGKLRGAYGVKESSYIGDIGPDSKETEIDLLTERFENLYKEWCRRKTIPRLVRDLRDDLDTNQQAILEAKIKYGQTSFTIEQGLLTILTDKAQPEASRTQLEEDSRLAREANKTAGNLDNGEEVDDLTDLVVISKSPIDQRALLIDARILQVIRNHISLSESSLFSLLPGSDFRRDSLGDWFSSCCASLTKFKSVLVDTAGLFAVLGIEPTNDKKTLRNAYRKIAKTTHPDIIPTLASDQQVEAVEGFKKATSAYRNLLLRMDTGNFGSQLPTYYLGRISKLFD